MDDTTPERHVGRRFIADFTVVAVSEGMAYLVTADAHYALSTEELETLLTSSLFTEAPSVPGAEGPHG